MASIREVAKEAGVSAAAVSRILNNDITFSVSPETRDRVFETAKKMNYKKSPRSRMIRKNSFTMGIVLWFSAEDEQKDSYYLRARKGVEDFCVKNSIRILRVFPGDTESYARLNEVDGLICIGKFSRSETKAFVDLCRNTVFLDMPVDELCITSLSMDFQQAMLRALSYITSLGHTKLAFLGGVEYVGNSEKFMDPRTRCFTDYVASRSDTLSAIIKEKSFSAQSGYEMMSELLDETDPARTQDTPAASTRPTAVLAANDFIAYGAMKAIQERGLRIPEDISVIGFNDEETSAFMNPPLTTIHAPSYDMGQYGANLVFTASNLKIKTPLKAKIPCELVIRDSCKNIRA